MKDNPLLTNNPDGYTQFQVAEIQFYRALMLFDDGDYVCALTLAGAAEEIFGKLPDRFVEGNAIGAMYRHKYGEGVVDKAKLKEMCNPLNKARNSMKHNYGDVITGSFDVKAESYLMLQRCILNYLKASKSLIGKCVEGEELTDSEKRIMKFLNHCIDVWGIKAEIRSDT